MHNDLIFDFGANDGRDTEFYLLKGFRVVSVEANPSLYSNLRDRFADFLATGQLVLLNLGVWSGPSKLTFYINLDNDHWSSFEPAYGCRDGTRFTTVEIQCVSTRELIRRFGMPYYMKVDIEGADRLVLADIGTFSDRPTTISVEEYGVAAIDDLRGLGYSHFQIVPQSTKPGVTPPNPAKEGLYVARSFAITDTGLFGKELLGEWLEFDTARHAFITTVRDERYAFLGPSYEWYDVHARLPI